MSPYRVALTFETTLLARSRAEAEEKARHLVGACLDNDPAHVAVRSVPLSEETTPDWSVPLTRGDLNAELDRVQAMLVHRNGSGSGR